MTDIIIQGIGGRMGHALCEMIANNGAIKPHGAAGEASGGGKRHCIG